MTGSSLAGVVLTIRDQRLQPASTARTDINGRFQIALPEPGLQRITISVSRAGYVSTSRLIPTASSPDAANFRISLTPAAVIAGHVEDEDGYPASGLVQIGQYLKLNGRTTFVGSGMAPLNDLGEYRIGSLPAGRYLVQLVGWQVSDWDARYSPEFYGGTLTPKDAAVVEVKAGEVRTGVDWRLKRREGVTVSVRLEAPPTWGRLDQPTVTIDNQFKFSRSGVAMADGSFSLRHIPPGTYEVVVEAHPAALQRRVSVKRSIEVGADNGLELVVSLDPALGVDVGGQILQDGTAPKCAYEIALKPSSGLQLGARSQADGSFAFHEIKPGHYTLALDVFRSNESPAECRTLIASASIGGINVLKDGIEVSTSAIKSLQILMTAKLGTLTGKVVDATAKFVGARVIFQDAVTGRVSSTTTDQGNFDIRLLPGTYQVFVATTAEQERNLSQADYRAQHANDLPPVQIVEGTNSPITLTVPR
jgi:hypothetical protein